MNVFHYLANFILLFALVVCVGSVAFLSLENLQIFMTLYLAAISALGLYINNLKN
jgi:hypothetical protein